ncbi:unnamed protein product [Prorocentrum cordatum]|uniref:Uncharacterized protein n=1 Tax=Prorocentrum cordatum TaxID=2364126 RepID=A0ABN9SUT3_9DINO|nr:unnamed protein product [Polarella glacialis]
MQDWHSAAAASARLGLRGHFGGGEGFGKQCCEFLLNSSGLPSCRAKRLCKMRSTARCGSELAPNSVSGVDDIAAKARRAARCVLHDALERLLETNRGLRYSNEALAAARRLAAEREEAERAAFAAAVADWRKGSGPVLVEREDIGLRSRAPREIGRAKSLWMGPWRSVIWQLCGERLSCCDFESSSQCSRPGSDVRCLRSEAGRLLLCAVSSSWAHLQHAVSSQFAARGRVPRCPSLWRAAVLPPRHPSPDGYALPTARVARAAIQSEPA